MKWLMLVLSVCTMASPQVVGRQMPIFIGTTMDGVRITNQVFNNGGVITFFRSGCGYCLLEQPLWQQIRKQYPNMMMVAVLHNESNESARQFFQRHVNPYDHVLEDHKSYLWYTLGVRSTPETFVIDKNGVIIEHIGYMRHGNKLLLDKLAQINK